MLRRRPDDTYELLVIEQALWSARPAGLTTERRDALRSRIMSALGRQEARDDRLLSLPTERWVAVPVGLGLVAAAILVAKNADLRGGAGHEAQEYARHPVDTPEWPSRGDLALDGPSWGILGPNVAYAAEGTSTFQYERDDAGVRLASLRGAVTLFAGQAQVSVDGGTWQAVLGRDAVARFDVSDGQAWITAVQGLVSVSAANGSTVTLELGEPFPAHGTPAATTESEAPPAQAAAQSPVEPRTGGASITAPGESPASTGDGIDGPNSDGAPGASEIPQPGPGKPAEAIPSAPPPVAQPGGAGASGDNPEAVGAETPWPDSGPASNTPGESGGQPPAVDGGVEQPGSPGDGTPDGQGDGGANGQGHGTPNGEGAGSANGQGSGNPHGESKGATNGHGNANGEGNPNGQGNGNENANSPGNGNANGQGNGSANGNANGQDNANAKAQGAGNADGQNNGDANGQGNPNASGRAEKARSAD